MDYRQVGSSGPLVSSIGLGCMGMSGMYGPCDRQESLATIRAARDAGITLLDTADFYGMGQNELLIAEALKGERRSDFVLSVKFSALRDAAGNFYGVDSRPVAVKNFLAYSLQRLGVDYIDIYRPSRLDPTVPIEETIGAIADMVRAGYVRHIGLSEVSADVIRRAAAVHPISDLQMEYSLISRDIEVTILQTCRELGIGITAYGVLSRGLISGHMRVDTPLAKADLRTHLPRFESDNRAANMRLVAALRSIASQLGVTVAQAATAWVIAQGRDIISLVGARTREQLKESLGALEIRWTPKELALIEAAMPKDAASGDRYPPGRGVEIRRKS